MTARELAEQLHLQPITAELLAKRGLDSADAARDFLYCDFDSLSDPLTISDMVAATARIREALENEESIVIYGDYDADGISSVSIFYQYFRDKGANVHWYIPEREEGYGINTDAVEFIAEEYLPDLVITCDCGVSAREEVEFIHDLGIDVIVTDHHELPELLPDCLIVNPKRDDNPRLAMLCGAGVVFKVVEALEGREYVRRFLDIAAIATIADSVPLFGENRVLAREGLKMLNEQLRPGLRILRELAGIREFNARSVAFSVVPRINAAGRVGEAKRAINLFCGDDEEEIRETAVELDKANAERQVVCDQILNDIYASAEFRAQAGERCLILHGDWQSGMIGIVASKLVDRFCRPCFIFTRAEGLLKGSGRSIEGVNLFELLSSMPELFVRFGGHAQAAGLTLEEGRYEAFKARVKEALTSYPREVFRRVQGGDLPIAAADITLALCKELELLEPCGVGNRAPVFLLTDNLDLRPMKKHRAHFSCTVGEAGFTAFGMHKVRHVISCPCQKDYLVELSVNEFREKYSPRANVRSLSVPFSRAVAGTEDGVLWLLASAAGSEQPAPIAEEEIAEKLAKDYGVLVLSFDRGHLGEFAERHKLTCEIACYADNRNNDSKLLFDPPADLDCSGYAEVIYLEAPIRGVAGSRALAGSSFKLPVSLDRKVFGEYFRVINRRLAGGVQMEDVRDLYDEIGRPANLEERQFYVCLFTFLELGFFKLEEGRVVAVPGARADLSQSEFYRRMSDHLA